MKKTTGVLVSNLKIHKREHSASYPIPCEYGAHLNSMRGEIIYKQIYQDSFKVKEL